jgi:site-specific DNA recombinase
VVVGGGELCIEINAGCLDGSLDHTEHAGEGDGQSLATIVETLPFEIRRCGMAVRMIVPAQATAGKSGERNAPLIALISRALDWYERLDSGAIESVRALAMAENKGTSFVSRVIQLAFLAPDIIEAIALGTQPPELTADRLLRSVPLPENWQSQRELLGFR